MKIYQVDAFTDVVFRGNPAAVCPLADWPQDTILQNIAMENNLSETAFYVKRNGVHEIRWFTPTVEIDLCGHATLASAFVMFSKEGYGGDRIDFISPRTGAISVEREGDYLTLDFPTDTFNSAELNEDLLQCFNTEPVEAYKGAWDYMLVFENEKQIRDIVPYMDRIRSLNARGVIVTAPGESADFVSRFFAPRSGIDEDPVTGSSHTTLTPYWSGRLSKNELTAMQLSKRGGFLRCKNAGDRTRISGKCSLYMTGEIHI